MKAFFLRRWWLVRANKIIPWSLVEGKVVGGPINRKVGPELDNYLKSWPLVRAHRKNTKVHARALVRMSLLDLIRTFYSRWG